MTRDDLGSLPIPPSAKRYARRKGLKSMQRQPKDYVQMVADVTGQPVKGFKNTSAAETTAGRVIEALLAEAGAKPDFEWDIHKTHPRDAVEAANALLAQHESDIEAALDKAGAHEYEASVWSYETGGEVATLHQPDKKQSYWKYKSHGASRRGFYIEVRIGSAGPGRLPHTPDVGADITVQLPVKTIAEAVEAARKYLATEKRALSKKFRHGYSVEIVNNDTGKAAATTTRDSAGTLRWSLRNRAGASNGFTLNIYQDVDSEDKPGIGRYLAKGVGALSGIARWATS